MAHIFASYLTEEMNPTPMEGKYDPEQELWVGDTVAQAAYIPPGGGGGTSSSTCDITVHATLTVFPFPDPDMGGDCNNDTDYD